MKTNNLSDMNHFGPDWTVGEFVGSLRKFIAVSCSYSQFDRFGRRMNVALRNGDCGMPHQSHYSERIRPGLSKSYSERMP